MRKYRNELRNVILAEGLTIIDIRFGRHIKFICEEGCITAAKTPSDWRNIRDIRSQARRMRSS